MPQALRACGLVAALGAIDGGTVPAPPYRAEWTPGAGVRNAAAIASYSVDLADRIEQLVRTGEFVVLLGGDCSILLGAMLGLRRLGRYGLVHVDGHLDFRHPGNAEYVGAAAGEDLALVTGRGGTELTDLEGRRPLVLDADVVALGFREGPVEAEAEDILATEITLLGLDEIRRLGARAAADSAVEWLTRRGVDGVWIHIDVDVLDSDLMPAVDSPAPDGLLGDELVTLLQGLRASPLTVGVELTIFDPDLDPDGRLARLLTGLIVAGLAEPAPAGV